MLGCVMLGPDTVPLRTLEETITTNSSKVFSADRWNGYGLAHAYLNQEDVQRNTTSIV